MTEFMGLAEKVSKFNQEALKHKERQTLNPFSDRFSRSPSPRPKFSKEEYGKPAAGSKTELRGQRAFTQISREILELCEVIHDMGTRRRDSDGDECIIIPFGELFAFYTKISDKVVGLLIAAKKRGFVWFEPEILFQRRDDDVLIALLKPMGEIRNVINRQISASPSPAPSASTEPEKASPSPTPSPLARQESNTPPEASSTVEPEKPEPSPVSAASPEEPAPSSATAENVPQQTPPTVPEETHQASSTPASPVPVEEEKTSSTEAPVVESKQETSEVTTEAEQTSSVTVAKPPADTTPVNEENTVTNESPLPSEEDQTSHTMTAETEQVSQPSETKVAAEEEVTTTEAIESEDQRSLTLKIIVEVEPDQLPPTSTSTDTGLTSADAEQTPASSDLQASAEKETASAEEETASAKEETTSAKEETASTKEETPSSTPQVAPDGEQTSSSPATSTELEHTLPTSEKGEDVIPSTEKEETPPSNDTGEKTLA